MWLARPQYNCLAKAGPDLDFGMASILVKGKEGKDLLLAGQKSGVVYALSPDGGKLVWRTRIGKWWRARRNTLGYGHGWEICICGQCGQ